MRHKEEIARVTCPADRHTALGLPIPPRRTGAEDALEPIAVSAATFASSLLPAFALGSIRYKVQIGAIRLHKNVAFLETHILGGDAHTADSRQHKDVPAERRTLTQVVMDASVIGDDLFDQTRGLCLGDVLDVGALWIWDPRRPHPLNLAAPGFRVVSRWDEESIVALRKGGFHKVRCQNQTPAPGLSEAAGSCSWGAMDNDAGSGGNITGSRTLKVRGVIKTRRVQEPAASTGGEESENAENAHGSLEGAKDRAR